MEVKVIKRVFTDLETLKDGVYMEMTDIGLLWCHTMLPDGTNRLTDINNEVFCLFYQLTCSIHFIKIFSTDIEPIQIQIY